MLYMLATMHGNSTGRLNTTGMPVHQAGTLGWCRTDPPGDGDGAVHVSWMAVWAPKIPPEPQSW